MGSRSEAIGAKGGNTVATRGGAVVGREIMIDLWCTTSFWSHRYTLHLDH